MAELRDKIKKSRDIKDTSLNSYICSLKKIHKEISPDTELKNTDFLKDFDKIKIIIDKVEKITSRKNILTAIIVGLSSNDKKDTKLIDKYSLYLKELNKEYMDFLKKQEKTETQKTNWIEYSQIIEVVNKLMALVKSRGIQKNKENVPLSNKDFDLFQRLLILRTYIAFPLRNDFADMKILTKAKYDKLKSKEYQHNNYLVISKEKKQFYINAFKNSKYLGAKILDIPKKLDDLINRWLIYNKSGYYLVKTDRITPMSPNGITKYLNKIFKDYTGKSIGTSMLRHIVISHLLKDQPTIKETEEKEKNILNTFLHSASMNRLYRKV